MNIKPFFIVSSCGSYHLGVSTFEEAIFGATGDYGVLEDACGYPSAIGEFFETYTEVSPYNNYCHVNLEDLNYLVDRVLRVYRVQEQGIIQDITSIAVQHVRNLIEEHS